MAHGDSADTQLLQLLLDPVSKLHIDALFDCLGALVDDCNHPGISKTRNINGFLHRFQECSKQLNSFRMQAKDFNLVRVIGRGAFGEVQLVRHRKSRLVYAMKCLSKFEMFKRHESAFYWEERDIMLYSSSDWLVKLHYAFQDTRNLYMVMEYMPGGDLVSLLSRYDVSLDCARFYAAEIALAIDAIHEMGYLHRDVKPDNLLITASGHVKLADFGTCIRMGSNGLVRCQTAVGTPDYISPEILMSQGSEGEYGRECDWWSVGVVLYELIYGDTPFYSESLMETYNAIMNFKKYLSFPTDVEVSNEAIDLMRRFLSDKMERLGRNGLREVMVHPFFQNDSWNFSNIKHATPPVIPDLTGDDDSSYFDEVEESDKRVETFQAPLAFAGNQLPFVGFTYSKDYSPLAQLNTNTLRNISSNIDTQYDRNQNNISQVAELEKQLQQEVAARNELQQLKLNLEAESQRLKHNEQSVQQSLFELEKQLAQSKIDFKKLRRQVDTEQESRQQSEAALASARADLDALQASARETSASTKNAGERVLQLEDQVRDLTTRIKSAQESEEKVKKLLNESRQKVVSQEVQVDEWKQRYEKCAEDLSQTEQELARVRKDLEDHNQNAWSRDQEVENLKGNLDFTKKELENSKSKQSELQQENKVLSQKQHDLDEELGLVQMRYRELQARFDRESATLQRQAHEQQLVAKDQNLKDLEQQVVGLKEKELEMENMRQGLEREAAKLRSEANGLEQQLGSTRSDNDLAQQQISALNARLIQEQQRREYLQGEAARQSNEVYQLQGTVQRMNTDLSRATERSRELHETVIKLRNENTQCDLSVRDLEDQLATVNNFMTLYKRQSEESREELAEKSRQLQSLATERQTKEGTYTDLHGKLREEQKVRQNLEENFNDLEQQKTIMELEWKSLNQRLQQEIQNRETAIGGYKEKEARTRLQYDDLMKDRDRLTDECVQLRNVLEETNSEVHKENEELEKLKKQIDLERSLKIQAINKLAEVAPSSMSNQRRPKKENREYRKREQELREMQKAFQQEKERNDKLITQHQSEVNQQRAKMAEMSEVNQQFSREIADQQDEIARLQKNVHELMQSHAETASVNSQEMIDGASSVISPQIVNGDSRTIMKSWLRVRDKGSSKRKGWAKRLVVLEATKLYFYEDEGMAALQRALDLTLVYHVRRVDQSDVRSMDQNQIARTFQIFYPSEGESGKPGEQESHEQVEVIKVKEHQFVLLTFHMPTSCALCTKALSNVFRPPPALECRCCRTKIHKDHIDNGEDDSLPSCQSAAYDSTMARSMFLCAESTEKAGHWVAAIDKIIQRFKLEAKRGSFRSTAQLPLYNAALYSGNRSATLPPK